MGRTKKVKEVKKVQDAQDVITDIAREYFTENGVDMVKITKFIGEETICAETKPTSEDNAR